MTFDEFDVETPVLDHFRVAVNDYQQRYNLSEGQIRGLEEAVAKRWFDGEQTRTLNMLSFECEKTGDGVFSETDRKDVLVVTLFLQGNPTRDRMWELIEESPHATDPGDERLADAL